MNDRDMRGLLAEVEAAHRTVADAGRPEAVAKRRTHNQMTARERIAALVDEGSFNEIGALVQPLRDNRFNADISAPADGIITGSASIDGRPVNIAAHDYTVLGGSSGKVGGRKLNQLLERSADHGLPLVLLATVCQKEYRNVNSCKKRCLMLHDLHRAIDL